MKSGIVSRNDPFLGMDPSLMVDPNLILDYGSSFKDEVQCTLNSAPNPDSFMDLINCNDSQLEDIILDSGLCSPFDSPIPQNEFDFEEFLKGLEVHVQKEAAPIEQPLYSPPAFQPVHLLSPASIHSEPHVANFEEVYSCEDYGSVQSPSIVSHVTSNDDLDNDDSESVHSFATGSFTAESFTTESTTTESSRPTSLKRKRNLSNDTISSVDSEPQQNQPKRRKVTRRKKRVQDERVKNQNKVAAMKYRKKKRDEKSDMDQILEEEEEKNRKLKSQVEELKVNVDVLKELLSKYLSPSQLNPHN